MSQDNSAPHAAPKLLQLQTDFLDYLLHNPLLQGSPPRASNLTPDDSNDSTNDNMNDCTNDSTNVGHPLQHKITEQGKISSDIRMQIYANAYRVRLTETIETDHEILGLYLGDELFDKLAIGYIHAHPSHHTSLRQFCDNLPDFLADDPFFSQYPILADIARFERRLLNAFDASDAPRASFAKLQALAPKRWPTCQLRFHPSVQLYQCNSNAVETWQALKQQQPPDAPDYQGKRAWLLWRGDSRLTEFISLAPYQLCLLEGFLQGATFAEQCDAMLDFFAVDIAPMQVLQSLQAWFAMGLIRDIAPT